MADKTEWPLDYISTIQPGGLFSSPDLTLFRMNGFNDVIILIKIHSQYVSLSLEFLKISYEFKYPNIDWLLIDF